MPSFHFRILNNFVDSFNAQSRVLVEDFHQAIGSESSNEIDVMPYICRAAINIICGKYYLERGKENTQFPLEWRK